MTSSGTDNSIWAVVSMAFTICYYILRTIFIIVLLYFEVVIGHTIIYYAVHGRWEEDDRARKDVPGDSTTTSKSLKDTNSPSDTKPLPISYSATSNATTGHTAMSTPPSQKSDSEIMDIGPLTALHMLLAVCVPLGITISRGEGKPGSAKPASDLAFGAMVVSVVLPILIGVEAGCFWTYRVGNNYMDRKKGLKVD